MAFNYPLRKIPILLLLIILMSGCSSKVSGLSPQTPLTVENKPQRIPTQEPQILPLIWVDPLLPTSLTADLKIPTELQIVGEEKSANIKITYSADHPISNWYYVLAAPYPTLSDQIDSKDLIHHWQNHTSIFPAEKLLLDSGALKFFSKLWGNPDPESIQIVDKKQHARPWRGLKTNFGLSSRLKTYNHVGK